MVKSQLARRETRASATFGEQTQYSFGVGMLFLLAGKNTILFDKFDLLENAHLQTQIAKSVSYSVAKHVSFFTEVVHSDIRVRLVSVEYMVEAGHVLHDRVRDRLGDLRLQVRVLEQLERVKENRVLAREQEEHAHAEGVLRLLAERRRHARLAARELALDHRVRQEEVALQACGRPA